MNVTKVWVRMYDSGKLKGFADVVIDDCMTICGFKIFENDDGNGVSVAFPAKKGKDKEGKEGWFPIIKVDKESATGQEFQRHVSDEVTRVYMAKTGSNGGNKPTPVKEQTNNSNSNGFNDGDGVPF